MSYSANQYNNATPLSSSTQLISGTTPVDAKYFLLHDNTLDGSYLVVPPEVGLWGAELSDSGGNLPSAYVLTVEENTRINAILIVGSKYTYPVDFVVTLYNGNAVLETINVVGNTEIQRIIPLSDYMDVTRYTVSVTKISSANNVVRLYSISYPVRVVNSDTLLISSAEQSGLSEHTRRASQDTLRIKTNVSDNVIKYKRSADTLRFRAYDTSNLINIHTVMKSPFRQIFGKVQITYTDPMLESETTIEADEAYNSNKNQVLEGTSNDNVLYFNLYSNDLSGNFVVSGENSPVGWTSADVSDGNGAFAVPQHISISMEPRPLVSLEINFDGRYGSIVDSFTVMLTSVNQEVHSYSYIGNVAQKFIFNEGAFTDIVGIDIAITKVSRPYSPAIILSIPLLSTVLYKGYEDVSEIMSIDLLEELTYQDDVEALGGMSANEVTIAVDNTNKDFLFSRLAEEPRFYTNKEGYLFFEGPDDVDFSLDAGYLYCTYPDNKYDFFIIGDEVVINEIGSANVVSAKRNIFSRQFKRNRKVEPFLGAEITPGNIEWYPLGTFWSYKWDAQLRSFATTVVAFDTLGLLNTTSYSKHHVQKNKSIGQLIEYVLNDAKEQLNFIEYYISSVLYDVVIPYAWFPHDSHAAALRKICECYPMHIYCDRKGRICAAPQKLHVDYAYDTWSDSTNVIDKTYSSLYTTLPNIAVVHVHIPVEVANSNLVSDKQSFVVSDRTTRTLTFSMPYLSDISVSVDCDSTVSYTYEVYSWGAEFVFTGSGTVRAIECTGTGLDISNESIVSRQDDYSIKVDGAITRDIRSEFIQTESHATYLVDRLFSLSENDKYDVEVQYRGDIALTINDPVILVDGIAPDNRYNIKRHQLSWNGSLTGTANLNT